MLPYGLFSFDLCYTLISLMASQEQKDAAQLARDLLGSVSGRQIPPQVQILPPAAAFEVPVAAAPEEKGDPAAAVQAPQNANLEAQSNPPVTLHRQLLSRLVRALPIASDSQLQAMLDIFIPSAAPPCGPGSHSSPRRSPPTPVPCSVFLSPPAPRRTTC